MALTNWVIEDDIDRFVIVINDGILVYSKTENSMKSMNELLCSV